MVDVVIRPEDIQIKTRNKGKLNGHVISSLFKGVYYDILVETKKGASKKITLHVLSDRDVYNTEAKEKMHAIGFSMDVEDVPNLSDSDIILRANAQAWNADTEEDISITEVQHDIKSEPGKYEVTFKTEAGTEIKIHVNVIVPRVNTDSSDNIGIQAFDVYKSISEIQESMAISVDLINWADAYAFNLDSDDQVEIDDVRFDFDPNSIEEGDYEVTFTTIGREYKVRSPLNKKEGEAVSLDFKKSDIHVMRKNIG